MFNKNRACQHLRSIGLSATESARMSSLLDKWHRNSGPEWTTERLKSLELYAKEKYLGYEPDIPEGWGIKSTRRHKRRFSDDLLHELFSSNKFDFELAMNFCRLSSSLSLFEKKKVKGHKVIKMMPPTKSQLTKMLDAIEGPKNETLPPINMRLKELSKFLCSEVPTKVTHKDVNVVPMMYYPVGDTSAPFWFEGNMHTAPRNEELDCWSVDIFYTEPSLQRFFVENIEYVSECILGKGSYLLPPPDPASLSFKRNAGTISPIQELGCKLRPAANPLIALQAINEPLKQTLAAICKQIPEIVTYNQEYGKETLFEWISNNAMVWSLDASSFTDRFPLDFQLAVLRKLVQKGLITQTMFDAFDTTSKMSYWFEPIKRSVEYKFGQPQGLGPSFALATLSHLVLLDALSKELSITDRPYRVLGDDVIIANQDLAHSYIKWMGDCNVEINMSKSIISNSLGEFAGSQVTNKKVIDRPKLSELKSNDAFISWIDLHKSNQRPLKYIDYMFDEFSHLTDKMSVPEDLGGRRSILVEDLPHRLKDLNQFSIMKTRISKDIKALIPYSQKDVINSLKNKEVVKAGIINSLNNWIDNPGLYTQLKSKLENQEIKLMSALGKGKIEDFKEFIQKAQDAVKQTHNEAELKRVFAQFKSGLSRHGYITADVPYGYIDNDFNNKLSKLINSTRIYFESNPEVLRRKRKKNPTNTGWKGHLK